MRALFRLQHALALTRADAAVLGTLLCLIALGAGARTWQAGTLAFDPALYEDVDRALAGAEMAEPLAPPAAMGAAVPVSEVVQAVAVAAAEPRQKGKKAKEAPRPVNVNTASESELDALPGIGPALAARVVAHREAHGPFAEAAHLQRVKGIGAKTFAKMAPFVLVN